MGAFTYRSARSLGLVLGIGVVVVVETVGFHLLLTADHHPRIAWVVTLSSLSLLWWLVADYRAMGRGMVSTSPTEITLRVGRRASVVIPREQVVTAIKPTFRDLPQAGMGQGYVNLMKHMTPNVLLTLRDPATVSMGGIIRLPARRIALHLDEPDTFLADLRG